MISRPVVPFASKEQCIAISLHLTAANHLGSISSAPVLPDICTITTAYLTLSLCSEYQMVRFTVYVHLISEEMVKIIPKKQILKQILQKRIIFISILALPWHIPVEEEMETR
jgi:hypothetical protein